MNDTDDYIKEDTKAMQILSSKLLGEMYDEYPKVSDDENILSLQELENLQHEAKDALDIAKDEYEIEKSDAEDLKEIAAGYAKQRNSTTWHDRQDEWEKKYKKAYDDWQAAKKDRKNKEKVYKNAKEAFTSAKSAVKNYKKSEEIIIAEFLLEMLKVEPSIDVLEKNINDLNETIVSMGYDANIVDNYSKLVESTQTLTIVVNDYIDLVRVSKVDNSITYLSEHLMDDIEIPDPILNTFEYKYSLWKGNWNIKLNNLENLIQKLPKFSESEYKQLRDTVIDTELLNAYKANEKMSILDELRRSKVSDINVIERAVKLLSGKYRFTAWFSFALAIFFDVSSLLAGLFIFAIQKKNKTI